MALVFDLLYLQFYYIYNFNMSIVD